MNENAQVGPLLAMLYAVFVIVLGVGAVFFILTFGGCVYGTKVGFGDARQRGQTPAVETSPYYPKPDATKKALTYFCQRAPEVFDVTQAACNAVLSEANVIYTTDQIDFVTGPVKPNTQVTGYSFGYMSLIKVDAPRNSIQTNAFVHEMVHVLLWGLYRDPASGHEADPSGRWTLKTSLWVEDVMKRLATVAPTP